MYFLEVRRQLPRENGRRPAPSPGHSTGPTRQLPGSTTLPYPYPNPDGSLTEWAHPSFPTGPLFLRVQQNPQPGVRETFELNQLKSAPLHNFYRFLQDLTGCKLVAIHLDQPISYTFFQVPAKVETPMTDNDPITDK